MAAAGMEVVGKEVCRHEGLRQGQTFREEVSALLTVSATLTKSTLPQASLSASVRPPFQFLTLLTTSATLTKSAGQEARTLRAQDAQEQPPCQRPPCRRPSDRHFILRFTLTCSTLVPTLSIEMRYSLAPLSCLERLPTLGREGCA
jgi:hypothetical protein